ncbi:MAG: sugar ABC transporter permease [Ruminococcaceae bacterium]|nr:sugar ABC transporter permease [Oscillospiraceae bacterium]
MITIFKNKLNSKEKEITRLTPKMSPGAVARFKNKYLPLYILLIPFLLWYAIFLFKPLGGLVIAFQDYSLFRGIEGSTWVGFAHFQKFLSSPYFLRVFKNTIVLNLYSLVFSFPAAIILALLLNEVKNSSFKKSIQTITYMPHFISTVVIAGIVINMLSPSYGIITNIVEKITGERIFFLTKPEFFRPIYIIQGIWHNVGFNSIIYVAALSGLDMQLYDAAAIDGANKWKRTIHITIPGILPTIMTMLILRIGELLSSSTETILLLYQPATYEVSDVLGTYIFREGLANANYDYSLAVSLFDTVIAYLLVFGANKLSKKMTEVGLW